MADNNAEIERLKREIQRANSEISQLEHEYETRLSNELQRIKSDFAQSTAMQQKDFSSRFKKLEKSLCDAYLYETDKIKEKYTTLVNQVNSYERDLESQIQQIIQDQSAYLNQKRAENAKVRSLAQQTIEKLNQSIQIACQVPVDLFYPHALQRYIDAGLEAEKLLKDELYSLALAKADCACMFVKRLTDDTRTKGDIRNDPQSASPSENLLRLILSPPLLPEIKSASVTDARAIALLLKLSVPVKRISFGKFSDHFSRLFCSCAGPVDQHQSDSFGDLFHILLVHAACCKSRASEPDAAGNCL